MTDPGRAAAKLTDRRLLRLLAAGGRQPIPVLVEVAGPRPSVQFGVSDTGGPGRPRVVSPPAVTGTTLPEAARRVETMLNEITGQPPVWLAAAGSFSVPATPQQVEAIAASTDVRAVSLNGPVGGRGTRPSR